MAPLLDQFAIALAPEMLAAIKRPGIELDLFASAVYDVAAGLVAESERRHSAKPERHCPDGCELCALVGPDPEQKEA